MKFFTKEWYRFCQENMSDDPEIRQPGREYSAIKQQPEISDTIWEKLCYHDAQLLEIQVKGNTLHLWMEDMGWENEHLQLIEPEIILWEEPLTELVWIYEELYRIPTGYELHVLFQDWKSLRLAELIVRCADIVIGM